MAKVNICNVTVLDNPSPYFNPFQFEITFECLEDLCEGKTNLILNCTRNVYFIVHCTFCLISSSILERSIWPLPIPDST